MKGANQQLRLGGLPEKGPQVVWLDDKFKSRNANLTRLAFLTAKCAVTNVP